MEASRTKYILVFLLLMAINMFVGKIISIPLGMFIFEAMSMTAFSLALITLEELIFILLATYIAFRWFEDIKISKVFPYYVGLNILSVIVNLSVAGSIYAEINLLGTWIAYLFAEIAIILMIVMSYSKKINRW